MINQLEVYMSMAYHPSDLASLIEEHVRNLDFDTFVGRGLSGSIAVSSMAARFNKEYLIIRKIGDSSHACLPAFGKLGKRWVFLDDIMASGHTFYETYIGVENIVNKVEDYAKVWDRKFVRPEFVGTLLYGSGMFIPASDPSHSRQIDHFKPELADTF